MSVPAVRRRGAALSFGSRAEVPIGCGNVSAQAVFAGFDRASGCASYAVRIANNTDRTLHALVRFPGAGMAVASDLHVAPFSILDTLVPGAGGRRDDRAIVEVRTPEVRFTLDARAVAPRKRRTAALVAGTAGVAACALVLATAFHSRGTPARTLHAAVHPRVVVHRVVERPLLDELEVTPSAVVAGSTLHVGYGAHGGGSVWLLDDEGRVWARRDLTAAGRTRFVIPERAAGRTMRVVLSAQRGTEHAQMSTTVSVLPDGSNVLKADPSAAVPPAPVVTPARVKPGDPVYVHFPALHGEAIVSITDPGGSVLEEVDVAAAQRTAVLRAPASSPGAYDVVVSTAEGNAQTQSIHALTVLP